MRRGGPVLLASVAALVLMLSYFVPHGLVAGPAGFLLTSLTGVVACGFVVGGVNLLRVHLDAVVRRHEDWPYKLVLVVALVGTVATGMVEGPGFVAAGARTRWIYDTVYTPLVASFFALLAFFIVAAAFRAFRVRTAWTLLLAAAALIVVIGRVPLGAALGGWLPALERWVMDVPQTAARRALLMGAALGVVATGFRVVMGLDRPQVDAEEER
jgi:hypothetical protein